MEQTFNIIPFKSKEEVDTLIATGEFLETTTGIKYFKINE